MKVNVKFYSELNVRFELKYVHDIIFMNEAKYFLLDCHTVKTSINNLILSLEEQWRGTVKEERGRREMRRPVTRYLCYKFVKIFLGKVLGKNRRIAKTSNWENIGK